MGASDDARMLGLTLALVALVGSEGLPEGHAYAQMLGVVDLPTFERARDIAVGSGMLTREGHFLRVTERGRTAITALAGGAK